ncbi:proline--tRNA ligase [archaeon]|jgi:prolyl-tRNA synthetase|nr:proline--tRNA ligase [archaeon]
MIKRNNKGLTVKKNEDFSKWFSEIIDKANIVDLRLDMKGFMVISPWGAAIIEKMYRLFSDELELKGHKQTFMPSVIPEANLKKESSHVKGFTPEVFWLKEINKEKLALRPTSETLYTPMFKLWARSYRDLPLKLYQRGSVFRLDTKATRPLIRTREILWIEAHDAFATKAQAEAQVQEDIETTDKILTNKMGIPFLPMKRPEWDKFAGAEYTVGSDCLMPDGKLIQQPSTHLMGQKFSKAFDAKFTNEKEQEEYLWTTAYGPAMSRILVSVISTHGDDQGLILPSCLTPIDTAIVPIFKKDNKNKVIAKAKEIEKELTKIGLKTQIDLTDKSPGEKFNIWELKGVPTRIEIGEKELDKKQATVFIRDIKEKQTVKLDKLDKIKSLIKEYDKRLLEKASKTFDGKIVECSSEKEIKKVLDEGKIAKVNFCSTDNKGLTCANKIEKTFNAEVRGTMANKKEKAKGNCPICNEKATKVVYIGRSY